MLDWAVSVDSTANCAHQHATNLPRTTGDLSNYTNLRVEPSDHAIGRSRGGLTMKIHVLVDGKGRTMVLLTGSGQGGDSPMFALLPGQLRVECTGPAAPEPDRVRDDKAYSFRAIRSRLRAHWPSTPRITKAATLSSAASTSLSSDGA